MKKTLVDKHDEVEHAKENDDNISVQKFYLFCELPTHVKLYILAFVAEVFIDDDSKAAVNALEYFHSFLENFMHCQKATVFGR
jgi:hypothetical protein